jgi:hypothetical protein
VISIREEGLPSSLHLLRGVIMKIENTDSISIHMNNHPVTRKRVTPTEISDKVSISTEQEVNEALKVDNPPYFPIGDTQAIFKK